MLEYTRMMVLHIGFFTVFALFLGNASGTIADDIERLEDMIIKLRNENYQQNIDLEHLRTLQNINCKKKCVAKLK